MSKFINPAKSLWKGTIGIVGFSRSAVAQLNLEIVKYGNSIGFLDDQYFPESLAIGVECNDKRHLIDQVNICLDFGCDIIVCPEKIGESRLDQIIKDSTGASVIFEESGANLAEQAINLSFKVANIRRPNLLYDPNRPWLEQVKTVQDNIIRDALDREGRFEERKRFGGYPILNSKAIVGNLGGAGPYASATLSKDFADKAVDNVHYSVNSAPGKHPFEMGVGPSYIPHYQNAVHFFHQAGVKFLTIPCNTTHKRLAEFCDLERDSSKIIDIRQAVLDQNKSIDGFILLGTNRTVGINLPEGDRGIYEDLRKKNFPSSKPFILPSKYQQEVIMSAIYDVKAGELVAAKTKINGVVQKIREQQGNQSLPVILGCTELPLANFKKAELIVDNFIDPAESMAIAAQKAVVMAMVGKFEAGLSVNGEFVKLKDKGVVPATNVKKVDFEKFHQEKIVGLVKDW